MSAENFKASPDNRSDLFEQASTYPQLADISIDPALDLFRPSSDHLPKERPLEFLPSGDIPRPYPEEHPARQYLRSLIPASLTPEQIAALTEYEGNSGQQLLTEQLREGTVSQTAWELDLAMLQSPLPQATIVYRAEGPKPTSPEDFPLGFSEPNPCYVSTTLDEAVARSWLNTATVSRILVPAGTPVAVVNIDEAEILLPRESVFETLGAEGKAKPNGAAVVYVNKRLVPGSNAMDEATRLQAVRDRVKNLNPEGIKW